MYLPSPVYLLSLLLGGMGGAVLLGRAIVAKRHLGRNPTLDPPESGSAAFQSTLLDVEAEALDAMHQVDGLALRHRVRLQIAIQPELTVRADPVGFRQILVDVLRNAIGHAPGGKVLLGGMRHGGRVQIVILDDGHGPDRLDQRAALRPAEQIVALQGGVLQVETHPRHGTLVTMRLPEPMPRSHPTASEPVPGPSAPAETPSGPICALAGRPR